MTEEASADLRSDSKAKRARKTSAKMAALQGGVSPRMVEMAKTVKRYGPPDLLKKVVAGEMSLSAAYQETRRLIVWARQLGIDVDPQCRIGGRVEPRNTQPCPNCAGTGRVPLDGTEGDT